MMYIRPFFALSGLCWPFGLVLYWVTTNLWTLGQQYVLLRRYPSPAAAGAAAATAAAPAIAPGAPGRAVTAPRKRAIASPADSAQTGSSRDQGSSHGPSRTNMNGGQARAAGRRAAGASAAASAPPGVPPPTHGGGVARRLGERRAEPRPHPPQPQPNLPRQQRQRQSPSKRAGPP